MVAVVPVVLALSSCVQQTTLNAAFRYGEVRGRLPNNGLRFVVMPDPTTQLVEVDVRYEVGSREDPPGKAGLAHLVEHLMFQQRPDGPDSRPLLQTMRQMTLQVNAYTNQDATHFMLHARADLVETLIKLEATRMHHGCKTITEDEFLREREVVRNEIREIHRVPEALIPQLTLSAIYPKGHAYAQAIGGDDEQVSAITLRDACEFIDKYYVPERAIVIVAGGIAVDDTIRTIGRWFQAVARRAPAPRRAVQQVSAPNERRTFELDIERPWVTVAWTLPDARTLEGDLVQFGIRRAFFDTAGTSDEYQCSRRAVPQFLGGREAPVFAMAFELDDTTKVEECISRMWTVARDVVNRFREGRLGGVETLRNRRKAAFISSLESLFGEGGRTDKVGDMVQFSLDVEFESRDVYVLRAIDKLGKFRLVTLGSAVMRALDPARAHVTVFTASKSAIPRQPRSDVALQSRPHDHAETTGVDPGEARRPLQVPAELKVFSGATRFALDNGMRVVLLPVDAMPVVALQLILDVGEATTLDSPLVAYTAAQLLAPDGDTRNFAVAGLEATCETSLDHTVWTVRGMNVYLDLIVKGLQRLITAGTYDRLMIERSQKLLHAALEPRRVQQRIEFNHQQRSALFGIDHPYTRAAVYGPRSAAAITAGALVSHRDRHFTAANATLVVAGAFDPKLAESLIRTSFGGWNKGASKSAKISPAPRVTPHRAEPLYVGVIGDEDPQVDIAIDYPSPAGISGQQAARLVLTEMLDDQMWSVRSRLGATYDMSVIRHADVGASFYRLGGAVDAQRAGEALRAMRDGIDALRKGTDFDVRFVRARRKVVDRLLGESTVSATLASQLGEIARFDLEPGYFTTLLRHAAALSTAEVKALLARELDPATEVVVLLGERASVTRAFVDAGLAPVELVEPR